MEKSKVIATHMAFANQQPGKNFLPRIFCETKSVLASKTIGLAASVAALACTDMFPAIVADHPRAFILFGCGILAYIRIYAISRIQWRG